MKVISLIMILFVFILAEKKQFNNFWYDGNAELSSYSLNEMRYGEIRKGTRVMVFVTEPLCLVDGVCKHLIKPDAKVAEKDHLKVLKLNDIREFNTGIYNYNVMTSIFTSVEDKADYKNGNSVKVSFTSQEWCGTVFERVIRKSKIFEGKIYSYFESEGEQIYTFPLNDEIETEDNLWILIRELNGDFLKVGERKQIEIIPSMWYRRKAHKAVTVEDVVLTKSKPEILSTKLGSILSNKICWESSFGKTLVWIESEYPHRILMFEEPDGTKGEILASIREPYWKLNNNKHEQYRKKLKLN